jgi:hypothetical protein
VSIERTGVRATAEQVATARRMAQMVAQTPLMVVGGVDMHHFARETFMRQVDAWAVGHGLPRLDDLDGAPDHYGMDADGEFTRYVRDGVEHAEVP